jgi:hypothetical protein
MGILFRREYVVLVGPNVSREITIGLCVGRCRNRASYFQTGFRIYSGACTLSHSLRTVRGLSLRVRCGTDELPASSAEKKKAWSYTSIRLLLSWYGAWFRAVPLYLLGHFKLR